MREVTLPKLNNNDDRYTILEWCFQDGASIPPGAVVAVIETSKVAEDLVAPGPGILYQTAPPGAERAVGEVIGYLFADEAERSRFPTAATVPAPAGELTITAPARARMAELGISEEQVRQLGKPVIKSVHVESLAAQPAQPAQPPEAGATVHRLAARQRAVAEVVTRSHATIPAAYAAVDVHCAGTPAMVIKVIGTLRDQYPLHFGNYRDDGTVLVPDGASVAVTMDAGAGLFMPVIRDVATRSAAELTELLSAFRHQATHGSFPAEELSGSNIGLALHTYRSVVAAQPIVLPGLSCMLSMCAVRREVTVDRSGAVSTQPVFQLGMSYDHRVINGRDAVVFLRAMKSTLERHARPAPGR